MRNRSSEKGRCGMRRSKQEGKSRRRRATGGSLSTKKIRSEGDTKPEEGARAEAQKEQEVEHSRIRDREAGEAEPSWLSSRRGPGEEEQKKRRRSLCRK